MKIIPYITFLQLLYIFFLPGTPPQVTPAQYYLTGFFKNRTFLSGPKVSAAMCLFALYRKVSMRWKKEDGIVKFFINLRGFQISISFFCWYHGRKASRIYLYRHGKEHTAGLPLAAASK